MRKIIPERFVECCDLCDRDGQYLQCCDVCKRQYCLIDEGRVIGGLGFTNLCRDCARREDVVVLCKKFTKELRPIYERRTHALRALSPTE